MINKITALLFAAFCAGCCTSPSTGYEIKGNVAGVNSGKAVLSVTDPENMAFSDTVEITDGRFNFTGEVKDVLYSVVFILPEDDTPSAATGFYLENAPITLSLDIQQVDEQYGYRRFLNGEIKGGANTKLSDRFSEVSDSIRAQPKYEAYRQAWKSLEPLRDGDQQIYKAAYDKVKTDTEADAENLQKESKEAAIKLAYAHPDVEYSANILSFFSSRMTLAEIEEIFNRFTPKVRDSYMAGRIREEIAGLKAVAPGQPAPDFTLQQPDGSSFTLSGLKGKYVLLDFWASWCGPCRASVPELKELYGKYKGKGLEIVGVTNDSKKENWLKAIEEDKSAWIHVIDEFPVKHRPARVATLYAIPYLPSYYLIGPDGIMIGRMEKAELKEKLKEIFEN